MAPTSGVDVVSIVRKQGNFGIALAAALILLLQSGFGSFAAPVQRDIFGNVICSDNNPAPGHGHDGGHIPNCCVAGCGACVYGAAGLATAVWVLAPPKDHVALASYRAPRRLVLAQPRSPANPRAPPEAA